MIVSIRAAPSQATLVVMSAQMLVVTTISGVSGAPFETPPESEPQAARKSTALASATTNCCGRCTGSW